MRNINSFKELESAVELIVKTRCPEKWLLVDRETGQVFQGTNKGHWDRLDPVIKGEQDV